MLQNYMIVPAVFLLFALLFIFSEYRFAAKSLGAQDKKLIYWLLPILFVGILLRLIYPSYPNGVFLDGAMGGYDAWCLAYYGVDSNLASYPVYLRSWGSGQSALYAYMAIPFIKMFGLNTISYRLPMALISCFSILFFYWTLRKAQKNMLLTFCVSALLVINPWHFIKSRFALDCNIFPDLLLIGICLIILAINTNTAWKKNLTYICGFIIISISAYGYGVSWFMLPVLYILLFSYLIRKKLMSVKLAATCMFVSLLIVFPLILFCVQILTDGEQYQIGNMTITTLTKSRHQATTLIGSADIFPTLLYYMTSTFKFLIGLEPHPSGQQILFPFGILYNAIGIPLAGAGLYSYFKNRKKENNSIPAIFTLWLISCVFIILLVEPNTTHWNAICFPLIYFCGYGAYLFISKCNVNKYLLISIFSFAFVSFLYVYSTHYTYKYRDNYYFVNESSRAEKAIKYVSTLKVDKIYYPEYINHAYIMFYAPLNPYEYNRNRTTTDTAIALNKTFSNIVIGLPQDILPKSKTAYVVPNSLLNKIDLSGFNIKRDENYTVLWNE